MDCDILVVGCGLTGSVIAREMAARGKRVLIWDRRNHIGGNMYDYVDEYGVCMHLYGPHTFHTKDAKLYDYMCKYGEWIPNKILCGAVIDGVCTPSPFNYKTIDQFYSQAEALDLKRRIEKEFPGRSTATVVEVLKCNDDKVRKYGEFLFEKDYSLYTAKQWNLSPDQIDPSVMKRVPIRFSYDEGYFDDPIEVMPKNGYVAFFENLLDHPNIKVELGVEALNRIAIVDGEVFVDGKKMSAEKLFYTGAVDELLKYQYGPLPYRSLRFDFIHESVESKQEYPLVAYPQEPGYTRITEYTKFPPQKVDGTSYAVEYPVAYDLNSRDKGVEPYYPVLTAESQKQAQMYRDDVASISSLVVCGRLGDFKYYNMDQSLKQALEIAAEV